MTPKESAGLLMYRRTVDGLEFFLVHPGGPYFVNKDEGYWGLPKGEIDDGDEEALAVARREFAEETGQTVERCARNATFLPLGEVRQRNGKVVRAWAFEGDWPAGEPVVSNACAVEWPPRSGREIQVPEVDRGEFFSIDEALRKINPAQAELVSRLLDRLGPGRNGAARTP